MRLWPWNIVNNASCTVPAVPAEPARHRSHDARRSSGRAPAQSTALLGEGGQFLGPGSRRQSMQSSVHYCRPTRSCAGICSRAAGQQNETRTEEWPLSPWKWTRSKHLGLLLSIRSSKIYPILVNRNTCYMKIRDTCPFELATEAKQIYSIVCLSYT